MDSGEPTDDAREATDEACDRWVMSDSLGALTVAMSLEVAALGGMKCGVEWKETPPRRCGQGPDSAMNNGHKTRS